MYKVFVKYPLKLAGYAPSVVRFAIKHPIHASGVGGGAVAAAGYAAYKTYSIAYSAVKAIVPFLCIPPFIQKMKEQAIEGGNAGLLDWTFSVSDALAKIPYVKDIPYIGREIKITVGADDLHNAIAGDKVEIVDVLLARGHVNPDAEVNGARPLDAALSKDNGFGDEIASRLMRSGADLGKVQNGQNIFHRVISEGKKELITDALSRVTQDTLDSADVHGNTMPHLLAVSPQLKDIVGNEIAFSESAYQQSNKDGATPLDAIMHAHKTQIAPAGGVAQYVANGATTSKHAQTNLFRTLVQDGELETANRLIDVHIDASQRDGGAKGINPNMNDAMGETPVQVAIAYAPDGFALQIAAKTDPALLKNRELADAFVREKMQTAKEIADRIGFWDEAQGLIVRRSFYQSYPFGNSGGTPLEAMVMNPKMFNERMFRQAFKDFMGSENTNILEFKTVLNRNYLQSAAIVGNQAAVQVILDIAASLPIHQKISVFTADGCVALPALVRHGFANEVGIFLEGADAAVLKPAILYAANVHFEGGMQAVQLLLAPQPAPAAIASSNMGEDDAVAGTVVLPPQAGQYGALMVTEEYRAQEAKLLAARQEVIAHDLRRAEEAREVMVDAAGQEAGRGIPNAIIIKARHVYQPPKMTSESAVYAGFGVTRFIENRHVVKSMLKAVGIISNELSVEKTMPSVLMDEAPWTMAHFAGSLALVHGASNEGNTILASKNLQSAALNTGLYLTKKYLVFNDGFKGQATAESSRSTLDFTMKYGTNIACGAAMDIIQNGVLVALTGVALGPYALAGSVSLTVAIDILRFYEEYTGSDPNSGYFSYIASALPWASSALSAVKFYKMMPINALQGTVAYNVQIANKAFGVLSSAVIGHQIGSLVAKAADPVLATVEEKMMFSAESTAEEDVVHIEQDQDIVYLMTALPGNNIVGAADTCPLYTNSTIGFSIA